MLGELDEQLESDFLAACESIMDAVEKDNEKKTYLLTDTFFTASAEGVSGTLSEAMCQIAAVVGKCLLQLLFPRPGPETPVMMVDNSTQSEEEEPQPEPQTPQQPQVHQQPQLHREPPPQSTTSGLGALLVEELRAVLRQRGQPTSGAKAFLVDRVIRSSRAHYSPSIGIADLRRR